MRLAGLATAIMAVKAAQVGGDTKPKPIVDEAPKLGAPSKALITAEQAHYEQQFPERSGPNSEKYFGSEQWMDLLRLDPEEFFLIDEDFRKMIGLMIQACEESELPMATVERSSTEWVFSDEEYALFEEALGSVRNFGTDEWINQIYDSWEASLGKL